MTKKIAFILLEVELGGYPLVPAYLSGYAQLDQTVKEYWEFETVTNSYAISPSELVSEMNKVNADVYAFSCYAWNMGLIKQVIYNYLDDSPDIHIILGGPQVAHQSEKYLNKEYENLVICNGEGEKTFRNYLKELMNDIPDFNKIRGLSFYKNRSPVTTSDEEPFKNLDEIPSPFSNELFDKGSYGGVNIEASRGCPFNCTYCYWGAMGIKPSKFSDQRIMSDIKRIAEKNIPWLDFIDANFGFFSRDVELAKFIVECKKKYNAPLNVVFSSYRKNPERIFEICEIFHDAGISTSCELPLQTMNETAMKRINRKSSDNEKLLLLLDELNKAGMDSFAELIWPLPGETLTSYKKGIARLCEKKNNMFNFYTLVLLNNIPLQNRKEEYGLVTEYTKDRNSEGEIVVQTNEVSYKDFIDGLSFAFAVNILYNLRGLYVTAGYLNSMGLEKYEDLFSKFSEFIISNTDFPGFSALKAMAEEKSYNQYLLGSVAYNICHEKRDLFEEKLFQFTSSQSWWDNENARLCFEIDLLNMGYMYSGQTKEKNYTFRHLEIIETLTDGYIIGVPSFITNSLKEILGAKAVYSQAAGSVPDSSKIRLHVNHDKSQKKFDITDSHEQKIGYCLFLSILPGNYLPTWQDHI